jgi:methionine-rich copper-binding protein CopC
MMCARHPVFEEYRMSSHIGSRHRFSTVLIPTIALFLAVAAVIVFPTAAFAHAKPASSTPAPNSTVKEAPTTVTITFGEEVKPDESNIRVFDAKGVEVSTGKATTDPSDLKKMSVAMKGTDSESYVVLWNTVSADDGDPAIGSYSFSVNPNGGSSGGATAGGESSANGANGVQPWLAILIGVIGLIIGGAAGYYLARRQTTPATPSAQ